MADCEVPGALIGERADCGIPGVPSGLFGCRAEDGLGGPDAAPVCVGVCAVTSKVTTVPMGIFARTFS